jgi:hypothetical protein
MYDLEKSLDKLKNLPPEIVLTVDSDAVSDNLAIVEKKHGLSLSPVIIFIATGDMLIEGIEKYLQIEEKVESRKARVIRMDLEEIVIKPLLERLNFINTHPDKEMSRNQEVVYILKVFNSQMHYEIKNHPIISEAVNNQIFKLLNLDLSLKDELAKKLLNSEEPITSAPFVMNGKADKPSVGNWLKEFIKKQGSDIFDNLTIIKFITDTENGKKLNRQEKERLTKMFMTYRNIKFFPESMPTDDGRGWEIIPIEDIDVNDMQTKKHLEVPMTEEEKEIDDLKKEEGRFGESSLERMALEEEINKKKKVEQLIAMANKYKKGSLEYRALMEEVEKIKKR